MQVLSKTYFRDTPEQDQRAWEQWGLSGPISAIRHGLPCGQEWGGERGIFRVVNHPKITVGYGVVWVTGLFSLCFDKYKYISVPWMKYS